MNRARINFTGQDELPLSKGKCSLYTPEVIGNRW